MVQLSILEPDFLLGEFEDRVHSAAALGSFVLSGK